MTLFQKAVDLFYSKIETPHDDFAERLDLDTAIKALGLTEELLGKAEAEAHQDFEEDAYLAELYDEAKWAVRYGWACWLHREDN